MTQSEEPLNVGREGAIAWLNLNRPRQANSIDIPMATAFRDAVHQLAADSDCRVVIVSGDHRFFSAGGDVHAMSSADEPSEYLRELVNILHDGIAALADSSMIVIAAVDGTAAGAGFALVLNADLAIATDRATFLTAYLGVGLTPDTGLSVLLPRVVGIRRATELLLLGRTIDADTALSWGLVNVVVPSSDLQEHVHSVAQKIANGPFPAIAETKRLLRNAERGNFGERLADEASTIVAAISSPAAQSALASFTSGTSSS